MSVEVLDRPAGYMVYELIGPRRFYVHPEKERWYQTAVGKAVLAKMAPHGLTSRDAYVSVETDSVAVHTDAGQIEIEDRTLSADGSALDCLFAAVAAGVAQERLLRLSGWKPDEEIPVWAVTASDVLVRQLDTKRVTPAQIWNADVCVFEDGYVERPDFCVASDGNESDLRAALPQESYVRRYPTGMHLTWFDGGAIYAEDVKGATLTVPTSFLTRGNREELVGSELTKICERETPLFKALAGYPILASRSIEPHFDAIERDPHRTELQLGVPMRTLQPISDDTLARGGIDVPAEVDRDRPLWMLTRADDLMRYQPRLPRNA